MASLNPLVQSSTLVYQSYRREGCPDWMQRCLASVSDWSAQHQFDYQIIGDEIFELNPQWFNQKIGSRTPILSDLARLKYAEYALKTYHRVIWLDADVFIFAPEHFKLPDADYLFGEERWVQPQKKGSKLKWKVFKNVCNALCMFRREQPFLSFYIHASERVIRHANPDFIAPQMIGPKLLSALHNIINLPTTTQLGSASPHMLTDLANGAGPALNHMMSAPVSQPCVALNLCKSLIDTQAYDQEVITPSRLNKAMDTLCAIGPLGTPCT